MPTSWKGEVGSCTAAGVWLMSRPHPDRHLYHNFLSLLLCWFYIFHYSDTAECPPKQKCSQRKNGCEHRVRIEQMRSCWWHCYSHHAHHSVLPARSHCSPLAQDSKVLGFPWPFEVMSMSNHWDLEAPPVWQETSGEPNKAVFKMFSVLLTPLCRAISTRCCCCPVDPPDLLGTLHSPFCLKQLLNQHLPLPQSISALWWKEVESVPWAAGVSHPTACSKQNNFLVDLSLEGWPVFLWDCTMDQELPPSPVCVWQGLVLLPCCLGGPWADGREQMCQKPLVFAVDLLCAHDKHCTYGWVRERCMLAVLTA